VRSASACEASSAISIGLALAREDDRVVALHAPEVRQVEDVVGRADDDRVEVALAISAATRSKLSRRRAGLGHRSAPLPAARQAMRLLHFRRTSVADTSQFPD
jgi:hypothetical protein